MDVPQLIYPSLHWWTYVLFYILAFMNNAAVNISVQLFAWRHAFILRGFIPRSGIAGLYGDIWGIVKLFSRVAVPFYIPASNLRVLIPPYPCQHLLLSVFLILAMLVGVSNIFVVLIYIWEFTCFGKITLFFLCFSLGLDSHRPFRSCITPASQVAWVQRSPPRRGPPSHWWCPLASFRLCGVWLLAFQAEVWF